MSPNCRSSSLVHPQRRLQSGPVNTEPCAVVCLVAQASLTFCNPIDCGPPGFSVHGILLARKLELDCHALLQGIFPTQGLLHWRQSLYQLSSQGVSWCSDHTSSLLKPLLRSHLTVYVLFLHGGRPPPHSVTSLSSFLVHSTGLLALPRASQAQSQERLFSLPCDPFGWDRFGSL